jgi:hypothetical protein
VHRDDTGLKGNHIYQILQDYQGEDNGGGYIRLLEIDPVSKTMSAKMEGTEKVSLIKVILKN